MKDPPNMIFWCEDVNDVVLHCRRFGKTLPSELGRRFRAIAVQYVTHHGLEGLLARMNGRTISQIVAEFDTKSSEKLDVVTSGQIDGVEYSLFEVCDEDASRSNSNDFPDEGSTRRET